MGLFTQGPQHRKDEWAGLPSEPYEPEGVEDVLGTVPAADPSNLGMGELADAEVTTIDIPLPPASDASGSAGD
ncbi:hypothetical protein GCM10025768_00250 [Microbacterium pseudoresistens]|uniref:Uncharacterized protein n=1 Tax=Microbacterium pseudoresistens TaxID=640634 RepID=A0A7Y9EU30_9MICO|nr:hypothetical protein [Microbacterium pseudoresistens]NYD53861.1 hypothetical protein [Microbacterium pseudoresistens]